MKRFDWYTVVAIVLVLVVLAMVARWDYEDEQKIRCAEYGQNYDATADTCVKR